MESIDFITYEKAISIIKAHLFERDPIALPIKEAGGGILAEPFIADRDFPPFDRVTMDGIAIHYSSYAKGQKEFKIAKTVAAGSPQSELTDPAQCIEIMTEQCYLFIQIQLFPMRISLLKREKRQL